MTVTVSICECPVFSRRRQLILTVEIVARVVNAEDGLAADIVTSDTFKKAQYWLRKSQTWNRVWRWSPKIKHTFPRL